MSELLWKVCGLSRPEDVALCHDLGVDLTGFVFVRQSSRFVEPERVAALPAGPALRVGVFAGADRAEVKAAAKSARLDLLQLHGGEDADFCRDMGPERVIKVLWPDRLSPELLTAALEHFAPVCAYFLFDAGGSGGGSGKTLQWDRLRDIRPPRPWFLAGGLGPENIHAALAACTPDGVDMNSTLETAPGSKDHGFLRRACNQIHNRYGITTGRLSEIR